MVPPIAGLGPSPRGSEGEGRADWMTPERLPQVRAVLLGLTIFVGLIVWVYHSLGPAATRDATFVSRLRGVGIMTWLYALVLMIDQRFYHSRFAQRRIATSRLPESVLGWLLGQMLAWFGIVYYALTMDARWFIGGLAIFLVSFVAFPIRGDGPQG